MFSSALVCLALTVYFEARNQPLDGQIAVAQVVMNRALHPKYPNTICDVVRQASQLKPSGQPKLHMCQFSFYCDGKRDIPTDKDAYRWSHYVALGVLYGTFPNPVRDATHYHTIDVDPEWRNSKEVIGRIGAHIFYR